MAREQGVVCCCGSELYGLIEIARYTRNPRLKLRLFEELAEQFDWSTYRYVLLPVSGRNHWSLVIVENFTTAEPTKLYHVNSLRKAHSSAYAFDVLECAFAFDTTPQQSNMVECGIYVLYYMEVISKRVAEEKPASIQQDNASWIASGFNVTKASAYRNELHSRLSPAWPQQSLERSQTIAGLDRRPS
ncbi:hypothetical protein PHYSODRAFT_467362 [Phytophthora sojae]|uniref:Ubiquitin-like protease family profile domain-containing protein n=1 Tax=Phytophthora sojae (strain P6497) TaxID=1094619 RepID=G4YE93_PHYSP|nr:hypothetical protein PHYSODRAFT_467362 [Phytophthora sojae]EGZ26800.1 hypothetical protein PHYSODRAFT_467362 [Phytophthora sojae]|eukprot:XP_009514075.1 hypothetical protein PHYSODRAFT_467362 [Phytophthora sojae]